MDGRRPTQVLKEQLRNRYLGLGDLLLLPLAVYLSYVLRLEHLDVGAFWPGFYLFTALVVVVTPLVFWRAGIYSRYWQYASVEEMLLLLGSITIAVVISGGISQFMGLVLPDDFLIPRSIPFIFLLLAIGTVAGPRLTVRLLYRQQQDKVISRQLAPTRQTKSLRVAVMGAGDAGALIVREFRKNPQLGVEVLGFLDDDPAKQNKLIHGVRVLGTRHDLAKVVEDRGVERVIIAMPTAPGKVIREIVHVCEQEGVQTRTMPGIFELLGGQVSVNQLRNVEIEDLLRREPVQTDTAAVAALLKGKCVLVTGAGGSIGSELCRQVVRCNPARLILLGHGENSIFEIDNELRRTIAKTSGAHLGYGHSNGSSQPAAVHGPQLVPVIADIRFADRIRAVFEEYKPDVVFHAAAHKHVPLMETNPSEAITNNVLGTRNLLDAAVATGVQHFVMISTDKAVKPTSVMGASKRAAELLVLQAAQRTGRFYAAVRFGNVLASRGSVVLTFKQQIASGGPVTVTDEQMARYFMTIPEAVQLVLQAAALGKGGEVFMLDMGEPVKIVDLAHDLIELSGLQVGRDIDIVFTGRRPGEKLFEELFIPGETYEPTYHDKIFIAANSSVSIRPGLEDMLRSLEDAASREDSAEVIDCLRALVPRYQPESDRQPGPGRDGRTTPAASPARGRGAARRPDKSQSAGTVTALPMVQPQRNEA